LLPGVYSTSQRDSPETHPFVSPQLSSKTENQNSIIINWCSIDSYDELSRVIIFIKVTADYYYPDLGFTKLIFAIWGFKIVAVAGQLSPQP